MPKKTSLVKVTDIRGKKPWLKKVGISKYPIESIDKKRTFLIVCEGQSEALYFKSFQVVTASIKLCPLGCSKTKLIECTRSIVNDETFDEVWCVFDMDIKPNVVGQFDDYNNAIRMSQQYGFNAAYSNDAFELWFVLHYHYVDQEQLRTYYFDALSAFWDINYERDGKKRTFAQQIYQRLQTDEGASQAVAIRNAKKLFEAQKDKPYHQQNPVTLVYELVEVLNKHIRH